jgi:hypothetical protein
VAEKICGFTVVRKPEHAVGAMHPISYRLGETIYRGIDRLPWEDLELEHHAGTLSPALGTFIESLKNNDKDFTGFRLLRDHAAATTVWQAYSEKTEIIAVWSPQLSEIKGSFDYEGTILWSAYDCYSLGQGYLGEWCLLTEGLYFHSEHFRQQVPLLNEFGLLNSPDDCRAVFQRYLELAKDEMVEPLGSAPTLHAVKVLAVPPL